MESSGPSQWHELQAMKGLAANLMAALPPIQSTNGTRVATLRFNQNANYIFNYERFGHSSVKLQHKLDLFSVGPDFSFGYDHQKQTQIFKQRHFNSELV